MRVLIITYYWPPAGGSGVQRWLKFVKYLQDFGITPVIYTVDNSNYATQDETLQGEVPSNIEILKHSIWEPNNFLGKKNQTSAGFLDSKTGSLGKVLQYIRANYFIPDSRKYWVNPSIKFLTKYLRKSDVDVVITTGPPHSLHLIGLELQKLFSKKWIADFRDPWTEIDYFHQLPLTPNSINKHLEMEKKVLKSANAILVVGKTMKENYKLFNDQIHIITNGFDNERPIMTQALDKWFTFTHIGMMNADRNPKLLWKVFADLIKSNSDFSSDLQINLIGKVAEEVVKDIKSNGLEEHVTFTDYMSHGRVLQHQSTSQVLLLAVNDVPSSKGIITGKIFEYLRAKRPIVAIAPVDGDLAEIISKTNSGEVVGFDDEERMKNVVFELYKKYKNNKLYVDSQDIDQYHRKNLTKQLAEVIKSIN